MTRSLAVAVLGGHDLDDAVLGQTEGGSLLPVGLGATLRQRHPDPRARSRHQRPLPPPILHPELLASHLALILGLQQSRVLRGHTPDHRPVLVLIPTRHCGNKAIPQNAGDGHRHACRLRRLQH